MSRAIDAPSAGLAAASCPRTPVIGGNVCLYNEGRRPDLPDARRRHGRRAARRTRVGRNAFAQRATQSRWWAPAAPALAASELAKLRGELEQGLPEPDIAAVAAACAAIREAVRAGSLSSVHDISDGGLACALAECAIGAGLGCRVDVAPLRERGCSPEEALFGEGSGGFLISGDRAGLEALGATLIGKVGGATIGIAAGDRSLTVGLDGAESAWRSLAERFGAAA